MKQYLLLILLLRNFIYAAFSQNTFALTITNGISLVTPKCAMASNNAVGMGLLTNINSKINTEVGLSIDFLNLKNFQNSTYYYTNWSNGLYHLYVNKETNIQQLNLKFPLLINFKSSKLFFGGGIYITHVFYSYTNQTVLGTYSNNQFPTADDALTKSIKYVFTINNDQSLYNYRRTNISPVIRIGTIISHRIQCYLESQYSLYSQTQFTSKMEPFHLLTFSINTYIKIK